MSSSYNDTQKPRSRPQQYEYEADQQRILRQTPPSAQSWHGRTNIYQTPTYKAHPTPLVLDPSRQQPTRPEIMASPVLSRSGVVQKLLEAATLSSRKRDLLTPSEQIQASSSRNTAAAFARTAPRAGFLCKLGTNIPEFKRRFFVLKPSTHLYYFLSPGDTEPRGCIDLEDANVEESEYLPDGRFRFAITLDERRVILEARSEDVGKEWMTALQQERLSQAKVQLHEMQRKHELSQQKNLDLEVQLNEYRMIEKDRDGALEDAANWKYKFEHLNENLRLLTQNLRRPLSTRTDKIVYKDGSSSHWAQRDKEGIGTNEQEDAAQKSHRDTSLLDSIDDDEEDQPIEQLDVPGTHFTALNNTIHQLRESVRLASIEASVAVEDLCVANEKVISLEKRMLKAEKKLCEQWEENCAIRQELKVIKQEKRVLVKEIRVSRTNQPPTIMQGRQADLEEELGGIAFNFGRESERLIEEMEEHVLSSIALNKQFLASNADVNENGILHFSHQSEVNLSGIVDSVTTLQIKNKRTSEDSSVTPSPLKPKVLSLFDQDSDDDDSFCDELESTNPSCISSVGADLGEDEFGFRNGNCSDDESGIEKRIHPILKLDDDEDTSQPNLCPSSVQSESTTSVVTDNGQATSRLICPLVDVVNSSAAESNENTGDCQVYHLTFYSRKIGIQFQKVPSTTTTSGALTEAMTADLPRNNQGGTMTVAELRRIADISRLAKSTPDNRGAADYMEVATSSDAVLVCGFHGFDDTANHSRPKLGARLVAFDGVSVEIGKWTFDSIRKAIQGRGRPLTLSFRNDFLTMQQRSILTKAVAEVDSAAPPTRRTVQYRNAAQIIPVDPELPRSASSTSHESDQFVNDYASVDDYDDDDLNDSDATKKHRNNGKSNSNAISVYGSNFRSFSEAGSSSVISSTLGPLMANLMTGLASRSESKELDRRNPSYLSGGGEAVDNIPEFKDFKASLL